MKRLSFSVDELLIREILSKKCRAVFWWINKTLKNILLFLKGDLFTDWL